MKTNKTDLLEKENINKSLLLLGIPTMVGMMCSALYNLVDTYFVSQLGTSQVAAVATVFPLSIIMLGVGLLFGCGASSCLSRFLGMGEKEKANQYASTALIVSMLTALFLVCLSLIFIKPILILLGATDTMMPYALSYGIPFIIGLFINVFNITTNNMITSEGATIYSMIAMLLGGFLNMILDPIFIFTLHGGVAGAAWATFFSRILSFSVYFYYLFSGKSNFKIRFYNISFNIKLLSDIIKIGFTMLIYQWCLSLSLTLTNKLAIQYGDNVVAAIGIVNKIFSLFTMMLMGFSKGYMPIVGYNYGAKNFDRMQKATKSAIIWTTGFCILSATLLILFAAPVIQLFIKNDSSVLHIGQQIIIANAITYTTFGFQVIISSKFFGMGKYKEGGLINMGRQGYFFIPILLIMSHFLGLTGIIWTQALADICSVILIFFLLNKTKTESAQAKISLS